MKVIAETAKTTYQLTFDSEAEYKWGEIAQLFIESDDVYEELVSKSLITNNESKENVLYWQDIFFMELAEQSQELDNNEPLIKKLKVHSLFISNQKFIENLPNASTETGREMLIDVMISNKDADELIPDEMIEDVFKKKSRDELRGNFEKWDKEFLDRKPGRVYYSLKSEAKGTKPNKYSYVKYLIAACFIGAIAVLGYFSFTSSGYNFEDSQFVKTTEKTLYRNNGLGFSDQHEKNTITLQIFDYDEANVSGEVVPDELVINTYLLRDDKLKLVLEDTDVKIKLVELEKNDFYLKLNNNFFKIEKSDDFQNLEKIRNQKIIQQIQRTIFENE